MLNNNNIAIYIRLSSSDKETGKTKKESNSIINQRLYINNYLDSNNKFRYLNRIEYIDDGFTGTNENRPKFQEMIKDARQGKIKIICVKDTSRLFRDYVLSGTYIECMFPFLGVRFISINDDYDSENYNYSSIELAVKNIVYSTYSKDLSNKIKNTNKHLVQRGKYKHHIPPYGYIKNPTDKYKLIIDPIASQIVQRIFSYAINGLNTSAIAKKLNEENIPTRGKYLGKLYPNYKYMIKGEDSLWEYFNIHKILTNEVYIGTMVAYKREKDSLHGKMKSRDPIKIENTHEPIVTIEEFEKAQLVIRKVKRKDETKVIEKERYPLTRKLVCGNCKGRLDKVDNYFVCKQSKKNNCSKTDKRLKISKQLLEEKVLEELKQYILSVDDYYENNKFKIYKNNINDNSFLKINKLEKRIQAILKDKVNLYEKYIEDVFPKDVYLEKRKSLDNKIIELKAIIEEVKIENENEKYKLERVLDKNDVYELARVYSNCKELTYKLVNSFIEKIHIYDDDEIEIIMKHKY